MRTISGRERAWGVACAIASVGLGLVHLALAGAPMRYLGVNAGALAIGLALLGLLGRRPNGPAVVAAAAAILATALFGARIDGVARWVSLGGLTLQPSLILLPAMLVAFAHARTTLSTGAIVVAAVALALQPDRAMAGTLALCATILAVMLRDRPSLVAAAGGLLSFAATLTRPDPLPAVRFVEQVFSSAFASHAAAGVAMVAGSALLLVPAAVGWRRDAGSRPAYAVFGAAWFAAILASVLGNYPTPVVGYGASPILGYALSLAALSRAGSRRAAAPASRR